MPGLTADMFWYLVPLFYLHSLEMRAFLLTRSYKSLKESFVAMGNVWIALLQRVTVPRVTAHVAHSQIVHVQIIM